MFDQSYSSHVKVSKNRTFLFFNNFIIEKRKQDDLILSFEVKLKNIWSTKDECKYLRLICMF